MLAESLCELMIIGYPLYHLRIVVLLKPKAYADGVPVYCAHDKIVALSDLKLNPKNPNHHSEAQIEIGARIIRGNGWRAPITISTLSGMVTRGHGRILFAQKAGLTTGPIDYQDYESEAAEWADLLADNRLSEMSEINLSEVKSVLDDIEGIDVDLTGYDLDEILEGIDDTIGDAAPKVEPRALSDDFIVPPFSVLDARQGYWQDRKKAWISKGIKSELGRGELITWKNTRLAEPGLNHYRENTPGASARV